MNLQFWLGCATVIGLEAFLVLIKALEITAR